MDKATMDRLQLLRSHYGSPLTVTSGYRSPLHSIEAAKTTGPASHATGRAVDIACAGVDAFEILTGGAGGKLHRDRGKAEGGTPIPPPR